MLPINTMAYGQSPFKFRKQSLLQSIECLDFNYVTEIDGFNISVTQPDDCNVRVIFIDDDHLYKFGNDGNLIEYVGRGEIEDILENGNTVGELLKVQSIPEWLGKRIYLLIALDAPIDAPIMPKVKISARVNSYNDVYNMTRYSPIYELGDAKIIDIAVDKTLRGNAQANVDVRLRNYLNEWNDWIEVDAANFNLARAIQFRIKYLVTTMDGTESAKINAITVRYSPDSARQCGFVTEIITKPVEFDTNLSEVAARIYHDELADADITAYVKFSSPVERREDIILGVTNGSPQVFNLAYNGILDKNVNQSTLSVRVGGLGWYDYEFDTQNSTIKLQAEKDRTVTASYECGLSDEYWREMPRSYTKQDGGRFVSRFVDAYKNNEDKRTSAVKFRLTKRNHTGETPEVYNYSCGWAAQI